MPVDTVFFTILRDPVERAISLCRWWNAIDISTLESRSDEHASLLEAIHMVRTQNIADVIASEQATIVEHMRGVYARQLVPEEMIYWDKLSGAPNIAAFDAAVATLHSFSAVLTTERLNLTFPQAMADFGLANFDARLPRDNASTTQLNCDRCELRKILVQISPIDFEIYSVAQQLEARHL